MKTLIERPTATSPGMGRRAVLGAMTALTALPALPRLAQAQGAEAVVSPFRRRIGKAEITPLLDGYFPLDPGYWSGIDAEGLASAAEAAFLDPGSPIVIGIAAWALRKDGRTILIDAGSGSLFGPTAGRLSGSLAADGIVPESVDAVLLTHLHPDHAGGLLDAGRARFPRAELIVSEAEAAFWTDAANAARAPAFMAPFFDAAQAVIAGYAGRTTRVSDGAEPLRGLGARALPGHTPGHTGWLVEDDGDALFILADAVIAAAVQFSRPEVSLVFDIDPDTAVATRRTLLAEFAQSRALVAGSHLPFPGIGHVAPEGASFHWVPAEWPYA